MPSGALMLTLLLYDQVVKTNYRWSAAATWYTQLILLLQLLPVLVLVLASEGGEEVLVLVLVLASEGGEEVLVLVLVLASEGGEEVLVLVLVLVVVA